MPFAAFMEEALYAPGGYYARERFPVGERGDFLTGSSLPLFAQATVRLLRSLDRVLGQPAELLEIGCGPGSHLAAVDAASPGRRLRGHDRVGRPLAAGRRVARLEEVAERSVRGLIFSYELFDALPVHRLVRRERDLGELWVALDEAEAFRFEEGELSSPELAALLGEAARDLRPGQVADLAPGWRPLYRALARRLDQGLLVTCDYGYERARLLDARVRGHGTLACYRHHRVHRDPFAAPGEEDLTAHVDFTALREAGEEEGLTTLCFTRLAPWLVACGLFEALAGADPATRQDARRLLDGEGMGHDVRVLAQARGVELGALVSDEMAAQLARG